MSICIVMITIVCVRLYVKPMSLGGGMKHISLSPEFCWGLTLMLERTYIGEDWPEADDEL